MAKRVPSDIFFNTVGLGLAVYLGVTVLFTSPLLAVGMFIASVIFAIDIYENVFGKPSIGRGSALAMAIFEIVVLGFFLLIIYNVLVALPYSSLSLLLILIFLESVFATYAIAKDLREAYYILIGRPIVLHYVNLDREVKHYVKEVRQEDQ
jgi:glucan phosphoethanolaminetransferase (alkaline phosphatase superfamily)